MQQRKAGILLPISSLPSPYGIGCFSKEAFRFVDWLRAAGQTYWQILPLGQTGYGDSPYQSFSSQAGNPYFIDLERLIEEELLTAEECERALPAGLEGAVDYQRQYEYRYPLLRLAYRRSFQQKIKEREAFEAQNRDWLEDYALFMTIKEKFGGTPLWTWDERYRLRDTDTLCRCREEWQTEIGFWKFLQYRFFEDWNRLKSYANEKGVQLIGDLPIYVSADSVDVWVDPELFQLDAKGCPLAVAGCPPDPFTPNGQLWGNPLYRWEAHRQEQYAWWIRRFSHAFSLYDIVRVDHFRGFDSYYAISYGASDAKDGHWEAGPGMELFRAMENALGKRRIIAEDLGFITDSVRALVHESGFAGMKILQFGFDAEDPAFSNEHLPHRYPRHSVAYTGTHDNPTLVEWLNSLSGEEWKRIREYLWNFDTPNTEFYQVLIALLMRCPAELCIVPLQDHLGLGQVARINSPSTIGKNWIWRLDGKACSNELAQTVRRLTAIGSRL